MAPTELTLCQYLTIALVPSFVPAVVLLIALGLAVGIGPLPDALDEMFEQVAGGALLITYIKELFPRVMEQGDAAVEALVAWRPHGNLVGYKVGCTLLMVSCISVSAIAQAGAAGFPGMHKPRHNATHNTTLAVVAAEDDGDVVFTPASTIAYFVGFFVDGVVLAYDDAPVRCDCTLVRKLLLSLVFAIDNLLDGFGLVPVLKEAFGEESWWAIMIVFSACVLAGATATALLRYALPYPLLHLAWLSLATTSILFGALELAPHGLTTYVVLGVSLVWIVLFIGDLAGEGSEDNGGEAEAEGSGGGTTAEPRITLLSRQHTNFKSAARNNPAAKKHWRAAANTLRLAAVRAAVEDGGAGGGTPPLSLAAAAGQLRERLNPPANAS